MGQLRTQGRTTDAAQNYAQAVKFWDKQGGSIIALRTRTRAWVRRMGRSARVPQ
jgi:hypothetical protein